MALVKGVIGLIVGCLIGVFVLSPHREHNINCVLNNGCDKLKIDWKVEDD